MLDDIKYACNKTSISVPHTFVRDIVNDIDIPCNHYHCIPNDKMLIQLENIFKLYVLSTKTDRVRALFSNITHLLMKGALCCNVLIKLLSIKHTCYKDVQRCYYNKCQLLSQVYKSNPFFGGGGENEKKALYTSNILT